MKRNSHPNINNNNTVVFHENNVNNNNNSPYYPTILKVGINQSNIGGGLELSPLFVLLINSLGLKT